MDSIEFKQQTIIAPNVKAIANLKFSIDIFKHKTLSHTRETVAILDDIKFIVELHENSQCSNQFNKKKKSYDKILK